MKRFDGNSERGCRKKSAPFGPLPNVAATQTPSLVGPVAELVVSDGYLQEPIPSFEEGRTRRSKNATLR